MKINNIPVVITKEQQQALREVLKRGNPFFKKKEVESEVENEEEEVEVNG